MRPRLAPTPDNSAAPAQPQLAEPCVGNSSASSPQNVANLSCGPFPTAGSADRTGVEYIRDGPQQRCTGSLRLADHGHDIGEHVSVLTACFSLSKVGYGKAKRRGGLAVHDHLVFHRELHREIARLLPAQDAIDISGGATIAVHPVGSKQPAVSGELR